MQYLLSFIRMIIVFSAEIVQIHHIAKRINFTLIRVWVSSETCEGVNDIKTWLVGGAGACAVLW
ncbi:transcriptional regulator [Salmonella enterica]|nr:transcriptional regulator [Salmonella enterica]